jgi:hypothetical protein
MHGKADAYAVQEPSRQHCRQAGRKAHDCGAGACKNVTQKQGRRQMSQSMGHCQGHSQGLMSLAIHDHRRGRRAHWGWLRQNTRQGRAALRTGSKQHRHRRQACQACAPYRAAAPSSSRLRPSLSP